MLVDESLADAGANKRLNIAIVTSGRFHVADLAREFANAGHRVRFYSMVPRKRLLDFGLPHDAIKSLFISALPWLLARQLVALPQARDFFSRKLVVSHDRRVAKRLEPCDVLIAMSGIGLESANVAKQRWGAKIYVERGSRHILSQQEILSRLPKSEQVTAWQVDRELRSYTIADVVTVLSRHCEQSFTELGFQQARLFRNPLGVTVRDFPAQQRFAPETPTVIFAGTWCWRKGADMYVEAARQMPNVKFLHVGTVGDHEIPQLANFEHIPKVDQRELKNVYSRADVFCLPSREEGLATVIPQALASGLRVVCSDRTGGDDLMPLLEDSNRMSVFPVDDLGAMVTALNTQISRLSTDSHSIKSLSQSGEEFLSWKASAARYIAKIHNDLRGRT